jgi:hypothetical protein
MLLSLTACSERRTTSEPNAVLPESPAPLQASGKGFDYNFDSDPVGQLPSNFHGALTGSGAKGQWTIQADITAPSPPNIFAQTSSDTTGYRFPLVIADDGSFQDLEISVKFKPVSGKEDQAAGLIWRLQDANNYYIVRANALESNVVLYKVENGERSDLALKGEGRTYGKKANVPSGQWSELRVIVQGNLFAVHLNDQKLYEVEDDTFKQAGKVGLWTKADSVTFFDDLRVKAK